MTETVAPAVHTIEARTHGRFLVRVPGTPPPWPLLAGFHGYSQSAADHLDALMTIPGSEEWLLVAVQALHRYYTRNDKVVASWMTREDREHAIADNVDYVGRVLDRVRQEHQTGPTLVFAGFSQGGGMAYRAAANYRADALIILAADVPPDVIAGQRVPLPPILLGRGTRDDWYTEDKQAADLAALARIGARVETCVFEGGHEWSDAFRAAAGQTLRSLLASGDDVRPDR
jgi:predicted esterase